MLAISLRSIKMADGQNHSRKPLPMANYSSAIARAVEWLGDRYLLAKPIKAAPSRVAVAPISAVTFQGHAGPDKRG
jgi:hypothetical protein